VEKAIRRRAKEFFEGLNIKLEIEPKKIGGLTTFCSEQHLNEFLLNSRLNRKQPFELYQGPPQLLPYRSPIFIFQTGKNHRLRAIARFTGWVKVDGWLKNADDRGKFCEDLTKKLEDFYSMEDIQPHCSGKKLIEFCSKKDGVRGIFLFDKIVEIVYHSSKNVFKRGDFQKIFGGSQPYAQGFPFRYLTTEETQILLTELRKMAHIGKVSEDVNWVY
jgi:hypothetical protein